jgi:type II secretory pathway pseudopilin PulG
MKTRKNFTGLKGFKERGEGLIQVLVAVAIIAAIAAGISSVTVGARDKSVATQLCNAVREIQDAKARFLMDNPTVSETTAATFADLQPYLTAMVCLSRRKTNSWRGPGAPSPTTGRTRPA